MQSTLLLVRHGETEVPAEYSSQRQTDPHWDPAIPSHFRGTSSSVRPNLVFGTHTHLACAERGITHIEGLANLDKLVGRGRFRFIGFPLRIRGGTASPIRAVAIFE
jgi:kynurenine formamidase